MRWDGQGSTVFSDEYAVAALLVPPINAVLAHDSLEVANLPVELESPLLSLLELNNVAFWIPAVEHDMASKAPGSFFWLEIATR